MAYDLYGKRHTVCASTVDMCVRWHSDPHSGTAVRHAKCINLTAKDNGSTPHAPAPAPTGVGLPWLSGEPSAWSTGWRPWLRGGRHRGGSGPVACAMSARAWEARHVGAVKIAVTAAGAGLVGARLRRGLCGSAGAGGASLAVAGAPAPAAAASGAGAATGGAAACASAEGPAVGTLVLTAGAWFCEAITQVSRSLTRG